MMRMLSLIAVSLGLALPSAAADGPERHVLPDALAQAECIALVPRKGLSRAYLPDGVVEDASIVLLDGRIAAAGADLDLPPGDTTTWRGNECVVVDISGRTVTPGLVEVGSQLGLVEVGLEGRTRNADDHGGSYGASLRVADAYDPFSTLIPVARMEGVTSAVIQPSGGRLAGTAAYVDLAGATQEQAVADADVAVIASLGGPSRAAALAELAAVLDDARSYARNRAAYERDATRDYVTDFRDLEALQPVLRGQIPLVVGANRAADIEALLRFAKEQDVRLVISGGAEAWRHAQALAQAEIPVIVDPLVYGPGGFDQIGGRPDNAHLLHQAGVPLILASFSSHNARLLRQSAGNAVRGGLDHDAAVTAISTTPARVFGGRERGTLAPGQVGNVVVFDGDPLELRTSVTSLFIEGRAIPLDSRQWRLFLHYRQLPGTPAQALTLPE